jgi:glycine/D-amino acid oxidase-like deaminating enzyme
VFAVMTDKIPSRSPWIQQLGPDLAPQPLDADASTDVAIIGAGIAGVATAFFALRNTDKQVLLVERDRVGRGATGHNAGQLTTYFERPLFDLVDTYGFDKAIAAQGAIDDSWDLLDIMVAESGAQARVDRFVGHLGMFSLNHVTVHLGESSLRRRGGLRVASCVVSEDAEFLDEIPSEFSVLYSVVTAAHVRELLGTTDNRYQAVISGRGGCANGALLIQQVLAYLQSNFHDRFRFVDHTPVHHIALDSTSASIEAGDHRVTAARVVMCTNGFVDHIIDNLAGSDVGAHMHHQVSGIVGYMAGFVEHTSRRASSISFIRNAIIGQSTPYVYVTRRAHAGADGATLTCIGGPEAELGDRATYRSDSEFPAKVLAEIDDEILPLVDSTRKSGLDYDYAWHGLMAYTESRVRLIGFEPRNPVLMYNLGCNGVGFLPSVYGGHRIARLLGGDQLESSIFDPP